MDLCLKLRRQVLDPQDNMRPFSHALSREGLMGRASERSRKWLFCVLKYRLLVDKTTHHVTVAIEKSDAPTNKPARELADGISGTEHLGDVTTSPTKRALWKLKSALMGVVVERWPMFGMSPTWLVL